MKILMLPAYCYPERISSSHLTDDLLNACSNAGINVEIYVPTPCRGIDINKRIKYKKIKKELRFNNSVIINRFSLFAEGRNTLIRAFRYILCNIIQLYKGLHSNNVDVIYSASTPPTQGLLCGMVAKKLSKKNKKKIPFIYNLQDVFPDSLVAAKLTSKDSVIWKIGRKIENQTYKMADTIIVISEDIKENIIAKGVSEDKIKIIPNWIDINKVFPVNKNENRMFNELGIDRNKFNVVYAGNIGAMQGLDVLVEVANQLKNYEDIQFIIIGDGSYKEEIVNKCTQISNVHIFSMMPENRISEVYSLGDLGVVSCKPGCGKGAVPSKTFSIMATATPVLLCFDKNTELWNIIKNNNCGYVAESDDVNGIKSEILRAFHNREEVYEKGNRARDVVEKKYSSEICVSQYIKLISNSVKNN